MTNVFMNPKEDLEQCQSTINTLVDWKSKNWAIGLSYAGNHQPDGFFRFFAQRGLSFDSYLRAGDLSVGGPGAYDKNIQTLQNYASKVLANEIHDVDSNINTIRDWQSRNWAIGLIWNSGELDGFSAFLSLRGLTAHYYIRAAVSYGDPSAYDAMIKELEGYKASLQKINTQIVNA